MTGQPQRFGHTRSNNCWPVADHQDAVDRAGARSLENRLDRRLLVIETDGNRPIAPRVVEHMAAIGGEHELDAEPVSGVAERARLIAGRGGEKEDTGHMGQGPWLMANG